MILRCESCDKGQCDRCTRAVRAFIEPSGPDSYACECWCNQQRQRKERADWRIESAIREYRRSFGDIAVRELLARLLPEATNA